ncbi:hypothetical protein Deia_00209 [Candidatus Deianiraea vastatrix]|uniref:Uncharacterized protein n=2 Tax=Candidatus Deianiraea vastatrix TaxID=2163644 RepID=A0A5B8XGF7_9RICK|nr:hypothetical protein Deia_00209 [Candidatus Deianiraea vastatrix]
MFENSNFRILDYNAFTPSAHRIFNGRNENERCYKNATEEDKKNGIYKPKLTLLKIKFDYGYGICLFVEFSAPKLLLSNNIDELDDEDFESLVDILSQRLFEMSVNIERKNLINAKTSKIHYSKNIDITNYGNCLDVINIIHKADIYKKLESSRERFKNDGQLIRFYSKRYECCFYDKIKEHFSLRGEEKKENQSQTELFNHLKDKQLFRMEFRFNEMDKLKEIFPKLNINISEFTFRNLFRKEIARRVCGHYWQIINNTCLVPIFGKNDEENIKNNLINQGFSTRDAFELVYSIKYANTHGMRKLKTECPSLYKKVRDINLLYEILTESPMYSVFQNITRSVDRFERLRLSDMFC